MAARLRCHGLLPPYWRIIRLKKEFAFQRYCRHTLGSTLSIDMSYVIRQGRKADLQAVLELVKELALFERAPHEVTNTLEMMEADGFGPNPIYGFFVAEHQ